MSLNVDLSGEAALITGASSGLGAHFARLLADRGAKVALAARRLDRLTALAGEIAGLGGRALPIECDVTEPASVEAAVAAAETELGPITILINNSGVAIAKKIFDTTEEDWDQVLDTNLKGAWLMAREVAKHLAALGRPGAIVNIASIVGLRSMKQLATYAASKAGLVHLTHVMARPTSTANFSPAPLARRSPSASPPDGSASPPTWTARSCSSPPMPGATSAAR